MSDPPQQAQRIVTGGNPGLLPETAKSTYVGMVVEDVGGIKNLSFNVDYFKFRINQVIVTPSATYLLSARGMAQFPNAIVRDSTAARSCASSRCPRIMLRLTRSIAALISG